MLGGLRTVCYGAPDLAAAKEFYSKVVGKPPYFDQPFYVGFEVGGFELGLVPDMEAGVGGTLAYWAVANVGAAFRKLLDLGATVDEEPHDVGDGIVLASVEDPWGNLVGIISNPHFDLRQVR